MVTCIPVGERNNKDISMLLDLWEKNVRATHLFLKEEDILDIYPAVREGLLHVKTLLCLQDDDGTFIGFLGLENRMIEMFFIDIMHRNKGYGKILLHHAINNYSVKFVDVNEQNSEALQFYQHMGFCAFDRSRLDSEGRSFPILHMRRAVESD